MIILNTLLFALRGRPMRWLRNVLFALCVFTPAEGIAYPRCNNVREVDFRNLVYPLNDDDITDGATKWLRVVRGRYEDSGRPESSYIYLEVTDVVFGDLTGDEKEEAAVAAVFGGVNATFYKSDTYIFACTSGRLKLIGVLKQNRIREDTGMWLHEPVRHPVRISNGTLLVTHGTEGAHFGPTFRTTFRYKIVQGKLVPRGRPVRRRIRYPEN